MRIFHVTTASGEVYGVASTTQRDALQFVNDRLVSEQSTDRPRTITAVGFSHRGDSWDYGTVLHY